MTIKAGARVEGPRIFAHVGDRQFVLARETDLESLWDAMCENSEALGDERLPYWTELWPAAVALAHWLYLRKEDLAGRTCLDLGCGLGFLSLAANSFGARVLGIDYEPEALAFCRKNAALNNLNPDFALMDWRKPATGGGTCDYIIGADIMYEAGIVRPVAEFLAYALADGGIAWLADPCRNFFGIFLEEIKKHGLFARMVLEERVEPLYSDSIGVSTRIWQIARSGI